MIRSLKAAMCMFLMVIAVSAQTVFATPTELSRGEQMLVGLSETVNKVVLDSIPKTVAIRIHVSQGGRTGEGWGSGAIISADGYIMTCAHVIEPGTGWDVIVPRKTTTGWEFDTYPAEKIGINSQNDYCLIKIDAGRQLPHYTFGDSDEVNLRQWVIGLGQPGGPYKDQMPAVAVGRVTDLHKQIPIGGGMPGMGEMKFYNNAIQHDAPIFSGNSGGPLVNLAGELIGINGAILLANDNAYATPINQIDAELAQLKAGEEIAGVAPENPQELMMQLQREMSPEDMQNMMGDNPLLRMFGGMQQGGEQTEEDRAYLAERDSRARPHILKKTFTTLGALANESTVKFTDASGKLLGYGVIISAEGEILTCDRVLGEHEQNLAVTCVLPDGSTCEVAIVGRQGETEIALVEALTDKDLTPAAWGDSDELELGEWLISGGGLGESPLDVGVVSALGREIEDGRMIPTMGLLGMLGGAKPNSSPIRPYKHVFQHDTKMKADMFGSPVFDHEGRLVGINVGSFYRGTSYAVPGSEIQAILGKLREGVNVAHPPYSGGDSSNPFEQLFGGGQGGEGGGNPMQQLQDMLNQLFGGGGGQGGPGAPTPPPAGSAYLGVQIDPNSQDGVSVLGVQEGFAAADAGLQAGDVIRKIDDTEISTVDDLVVTLQNYKAGDKVTITIDRDGEEIEIEATLSARP
ncbi:MAG: trypsin-like peptidase domain-containing protein [Planctomycetes bacterium]|nr:trypsin-like peptidase domain-containing protein [Planctomycetota bacterium]